MTQLIIKIENGQPVGHPLSLENFRAAFPSVDPLAQGGGYAPFERVTSKEAVGKYEVSTGNHWYGWVGDVVKDVWETREMTPEEKAIVDSYDQFETE
jgi:hypothetical protein